MNLVIAWRIMRMTLLGRESPGLPAEVLFSDVELRPLRAFAKKSLKPPVLLAEAVRLAAKIGGYLGRLRRMADQVVRVRHERGMILPRYLWVKGRAS